jgi:hypothetical protein
MLDGGSDRLSGVCREVRPPTRIEAIDGVDQGEVALLDQIVQVKAWSVAAPRDHYDKAQVRGDQASARGTVAGRDLPCKLDLLGARQLGLVPGLGQVCRRWHAGNVCLLACSRTGEIAGPSMIAPAIRASRRINSYR